MFVLSENPHNLIRYTIDEGKESRNPKTLKSSNNNSDWRNVKRARFNENHINYGFYCHDNIHNERCQKSI